MKIEKNKIVYEINLKSRKEKFVVRIKDPGHYDICARYYKLRKGKELSKNIHIYFI